MADSLEPDLVIVDIGMPVLDGLEATRQIVAARGGTRVLILTIHESEETVLQVLEAGARGYRSITKPEQKHLGQAITFELSKVETAAIRLRMLGHLAWIDETLAKQVRDGLGVDGGVEKIKPAREPSDLDLSPALRLHGKYKETLAGRKIGLLLGQGFNAALKKELVAAITKEKAKVATITTKIQGERDAEGAWHPADMALRASPSVLFDAVLVLTGPDGDKALAEKS